MMKIAHNVTTDNDITLDDIRRKKSEVRENMHKEWGRIASTTDNIISPFTKPLDNSSGIIRSIKIGWMACEGIFAGIRLARKTMSLFHHKKK